MIPEDLYKKLLHIFGTSGIKKDCEQEMEKLNAYREAIDNFGSYDKFDAYWVLDGIWGTIQDHKTMAEEYQKLYDELNKKRHEKWGDDCEP